MLTGPLLLPPVVIGGLLLLSGVLKLRHAEASRSAFAQLELPRALTESPAPRVLPWAEIALAAALLPVPAPGALPIALLALLLFAAYLVVIARALRFDHPVTCGCFGELGLGEVTPRTLVRNIVLLALAALTVWSATAEASVAARLATAPATTWTWLAVVVLVGAALVTTFGGTKGSPLASSPGRETEDDQEADGKGALDYVRQPLPFASLADEDDDSRSLAELARESAHLLVFVSPGCGSCAEVIARIPSWARDLGPVRVRAVVAQRLDLVTEQIPDLAGHLLHDPQGTTARIFGLGTPGAVLLGMDGLLAGGPVQGRQAVVEFVDDVRAELVDGGVISDGR